MRLFVPFYTFVFNFAAAQALEYNNSLPSTIQWGECDGQYNITVECGSLDVPLDYTALNTSETLSLQLFKVNAVREPFLGSILINPGGPGQGGLAFMERNYENMIVMTGGHHDVIAFDPRGTGITLNYTCFTDPAEQAKSTMVVPYSANQSDTALGNGFSLQRVYGQRCRENGAHIGELMGTAFLARDLMQIVDALDEDGMLRFWGQSYGSYVGQVVAAMFPDRIDRLVIDGVLNPHDYTDGWEYDIGAAGDLALQEWATQCINVGFPACALAAHASDVTPLLDVIVGLIDAVKFEPIIMGSSNIRDIVDLPVVLYITDSMLRQAMEFAPIAPALLHAVLERNTTAWDEILTALPGFLPIASSGDAVHQIHCSDTLHRTEELGEIESRVQRMSASSPLWGPIWSMQSLTCATYQLSAKGRYTGDFRAPTRNPALLIGSPYDLRTPISGAHNASATLDGSVVLQHNGHSHCVLFSPGQCAIRTIQRYFINGTLPEPGTVCEQDYGIFSGRSPSDSFVLSEL